MQARLAEAGAAAVDVVADDRPARRRGVHAQLMGAVRQVLIESASQGRTEHFLPVAIIGEVPGAVRALTIAGHDGARLTV